MSLSASLCDLALVVYRHRCEGMPPQLLKWSFMTTVTRLEGSTSERRHELASVRQHHGSWYVVYRDPGRKRQIWENCGKRQRDAEDRCSDIELSLARGISPFAERLTFAEAWERWMHLKELSETTRADYGSIYRTHIEPFFVGESIRLRDIDPSVIDDFILSRRKAGIRDGRLIRVLITLKAFLNWCASRDYLPTKPTASWFAMPKSMPKKVTPLTVPQIEALIAVTSPRYRVFVAFLAYTGTRLSEAISVRWIDLDPEFTEVWIRRKLEVETVRDYTKTRGDRHTPIIPRLRELLLAYHAEQGYPTDGWLFTRVSGRLIDKNSFRKDIFKPSLRRAGLDSTIRIHDLRHSCASLLHASGTMPRDIMDALGWKQMSTMLRYTHSMDSGAQIARRMHEKWLADMAPAQPESLPQQTPEPPVSS